MRRLRKSARAEADLLDVWQYTHDRWGEEQAERYLLALEAGLERLVSDPLIGRAREDLQDGMRSFPLEHHAVFYLVESEAVYVVRVLHERADTEVQFVGEE